jgi:A/G-specific adenine glycosylase
MPWRETKDPYKIWISEIMLQQTQVATVIAYYNRFIDRFPSVESLAQASEDEVFKLWEGLGYYSRARNLMKCAKEVTADFDGIFPSDLKVLKSLPGIGPYTAGALMSIAFNQPFPAVDGNVMRVLARHDHIAEDISQPRSKRIFEEIVLKRIPEDTSSFNQALMELGALICLPRNPKCEECPVRSTCIAFEKQIQHELPVKTKKTKQKKEKMAFLWIEMNEKILMQKSDSTGLLAGLWTLPRLRVEKDENIESVIAGYLTTHYQMELIGAEEIKTSMHVFTHKIWEMTLFRITFSQDHLRESENQWLSRDEIKKLALSKAVQKVMEGI